MRLWRHLFGASQHLLGPEADPGEAWPASLGPRPPGPAFDWLAGIAYACWLANEEAAAQAAGPGDPCAPAEIVRAVHDKAFAAEFADSSGYLPACLRDLSAIYAPRELAEAGPWLAALKARLADWPAWTRGRFTLKPRQGSSGRGRVGGIADSLDEAKLRAALPRLAERGGAILEPWLDRSDDLSVMLHIAPPRAGSESSLSLLGTAQQIVAPSGVYLGHRGEIDSRGRVFSGSRHEESVREAAAALANAALAAGYWGPCGVDGFAFRRPPEDPAHAGTEGPASETELRPLVEFNARFTVGIVVVGLIRRALPRVKAEIGLEPGQRAGFLFGLEPPPGWSDWPALSEARQAACLHLPLSPDPRGPALLFDPDAEALRQLVTLPG